MGRVAHHHPGRSGEGRHGARGTGAPGSGLTEGDEGRNELRRRQKGAGEDRAHGAQHEPDPQASWGEGLPAAPEERAGEPHAEQEAARARGLLRPGQQEEGDGRRETGRGQSAGPPEVRLQGEEGERQEGRGHHGRGVAEVRHEVGAEGEAEPGHEAPDGTGPEAPGVEVDERPGETERRQDEDLEGRERGERRQGEHQGVQGSRAVGGQERRPGEGGGVPGGNLAPRPGPPRFDAQRQVERGGIARREEAALAPGGRGGEERGRGEEEKKEQPPHGETLARGRSRAGAGR